MENNFEQETFLDLKELLMTGDINRITSSLDMDNMVNVDLEMIGIKTTSYYDDYHHLIGLQPSEHVADYALNLYRNQLCSSQLLDFYMSGVFRLTRSSARRLSYKEHEFNQESRYYPWGIQDDFSLIFKRAISMIDMASEISEIRLPMLRSILDSAHSRLQRLKK